MGTATLTKPPAVKQVQIRPQPGPQERFLATPADIAIYGGSAGCGKTWGLLLEPLRHYKVQDFGAVIFRRSYPEIMNKGGMWEESQKLYPYLRAKSRETSLEWRFGPNPAHPVSTIRFAHLQLEKTALDWKGAQVPLLEFDQLETFTEYQFWYLLSRNRSLCGVAPYVRATVNPVPEDDEVGGWLHRLISWWLDEETGLPRLDRAGVLRWFARVGETLVWGNTAKVVALQQPTSVCPESAATCRRGKWKKQCELAHAKSLTFIPGTLADNPALTTVDPGYRANLMALPLVERERLLGGNWKVRPTAGMIFNRAWFKLVEMAPATGCVRVRYWDKAGTQDAGCHTAGVRLAYHVESCLVYVEDVVRGQWSAHQREKTIKQTAELDGTDVDIWVEQEPGSGGKESAENTIRNLPGFTVRADRVTGDKVVRASPLASYAEAGNVLLVNGSWCKAFLDELHAFTPKATFKDQVDGASGAFNKAVPMRQLELSGGGASDEERTVRYKDQEVDRGILVELTERGVYFPGGDE